MSFVKAFWDHPTKQMGKKANKQHHLLAFSCYQTLIEPLQCRTTFPSCFFIFFICSFISRHFHSLRKLIMLLSVVWGVPLLCYRMTGVGLFLKQSRQESTEKRACSRHRYCILSAARESVMERLRGRAGRGRRDSGGMKDLRLNGKSGSEWNASCSGQQMLRLLGCCSKWVS